MTDIDPRLATTVPHREWPNCRPRDAASMIIVDLKNGQPRVLMGRRHEGHVFMPGMYVFPGGRVDPADHRVGTVDTLDPNVAAKLLVDLKGRRAPGRARTFALTAIRETFEETGLLIGEKTDAPLSSRSPVWNAFLAHGVVPKLASMRFVARAITPPGRRRRYDTRFFCVSAENIALKAAPLDGELLELCWLTPAETHALELPLITRVILDELVNRLISGGGLPDADARVPYYAMRYGRFKRDLI